MGEPVDTSAEAVERFVGVLGSFDARSGYGNDLLDRAAHLLRALAKERAEQETLLAERNRDAERYRWLRDGCDHKSHIANHIVSRYYGMDWGRKIDAAMGAKDEPPVTSPELQEAGRLIESFPTSIRGTKP